MVLYEKNLFFGAVYTYPRLCGCCEQSFRGPCVWNPCWVSAVFLSGVHLLYVYLFFLKWSDNKPRLLGSFWFNIPQACRSMLGS